MSARPFIKFLIITGIILIFCAIFYVFYSLNNNQLMGPVTQKFLQENRLYPLYETAEKNYFKWKKDTEQNNQITSELYANIEQNRKLFYSDLEHILSQKTYNQAYKKNFAMLFFKKMLDPYSYLTYPDQNLSLKIGVKYHPLMVIKHLQENGLKRMDDRAEYLILTAIYQPANKMSDTYKQTALNLHHQFMDYFKSNHFGAQTGWENYQKIMGDKDVLACYQDLACLISILPYEIDVPDWDNICIPCEYAQKYNRVAYFDSAGGGHGSMTYFLSDCDLDEKFKFPAAVEQFYKNIDDNRYYEVGGSIRFLVEAQDLYKKYRDLYFPDFDFNPVPIMEDSLQMPVSKWALASFYNWNRYHQMMTQGIGFISAYKALKNHYIEVFDVSHEAASKAAWAALLPPGLENETADLNSIRYLILSGAPLEQIKNHPFRVMDEDSFLSTSHDNLFTLAVDRPEVMAFLLEKCAHEENCTSQLLFENNENPMKKTALMYGAQNNLIRSVQYLIDQGFDINKQTADSDCINEQDFVADEMCVHNGNRTALMYAVQNGHYDMVLLLLKNGADIFLKDSMGMTAYDYLTGKAPFGNPHILVSISGGAYPQKEKGQKILPPFSTDQFNRLKTLLNPNEKKGIDRNEKKG